MGVEEIVAPREDHVRPFEKRGHGENDIAVLGRWGQEVVVAYGELGFLKGPDVLVHVASLGQEVASHGINELDITGKAVGRASRILDSISQPNRLSTILVPQSMMRLECCRVAGSRPSSHEISLNFPEPRLPVRTRGLVSRS